MDMGSMFAGTDASAPCQVEGKNCAHDLNQKVIGEDLRYVGVVSLH